MIVGACQRWREQRGAYRPAGERFVARHWEVAPIADDRTARAFVQHHHYSGSYPAARRRFGLYSVAGELAGVAVFSVPAQPKALDVLPGDRSTCAELGRFVLLDAVQANGESWFLARCFDALRREGWTGILSFSDPVPRTDADGRIVFAGHLGTIYQASNATFTGRSKPRIAKLLPDGTVLNERAVAKIRARDTGWRYAAAMLERHGAEPLTEHEDAAAWVGRWVPRVTRPLRHGGNLRYLWALDKRDRKHLPKGSPYPKVVVHQVV